MKIVDPLLAPYSIEADGNQFSITERKKVHAGKNKGEMADVAFAHFTTLESAINTVIKLKLGEQQITVSLKQYIDRWKEITEDLKNLLTVK